MILLRITLAAAIVVSASSGTGARPAEHVGAGSDQRTQASPLPTLADLRGVGELQALFNRDAGKVRLLLLLSPT